MITRPTTLPEYFSTLTPAERAAANSHLLNILRANPWLSRFYAGCLQLIPPNPNQINTLQTRSENFSNPDPKGSYAMSLNQNVRSCTHIKVNGVRCGSPALHAEVFCYFHQRMFRGVSTPPKSRLHPIALIENEEGIQASLMEIINALIRNTIDYRRAQLVLRALHIAVKNSPRVHFDIYGKEMVRDVPDYPDMKPPSSALGQASALARIQQPKPISITPPKPAVVVAQPEPARPKPPIVAAQPEPARPKPPARVKLAPPVRNFARRRSG
jgi:hypothetical protein